jgi:hypothetical protein
MSDFNKPAFPTPSSLHGKPFNGLTKLELFTGFAMVGLIASGYPASSLSAKKAIEHAKEVLNQLEEETE